MLMLFTLQHCIKMVKTEIRGMVDQIKMSNPQLVARVAFVGYADYGDPQPPQLDFTQDVQQFQNLLDTVVAGGGGDAAEDVFSGLQAASRLSWSSSNRILVHVADCPCHGAAYHDSSIGDDYPGGDKYGRQGAVLLQQLAEGCRLDAYLFCHLTQYTKQMVTVFQELLGRLLISSSLTLACKLS